jgi:hypothetical protein
MWFTRPSIGPELHRMVNPQVTVWQEAATECRQIEPAVRRALQASSPSGWRIGPSGRGWLGAPVARRRDERPHGGPGGDRRPASTFAGAIGVEAISGDVDVGTSAGQVTLANLAGVSVRPPRLGKVRGPPDPGWWRTPTPER